jgi:hypothetical protein
MLPMWKIALKSKLSRDGAGKPQLVPAWHPLASSTELAVALTGSLLRL